MKCACGCPEQARGKSAYASDACRARAWRQRVGYGPQKRLQGRSNGKTRASRPSDVRVTYQQAYEVLVRELGSPLRARDLAEQMLTDKQRARVRELGL